MHPDEVQEHEVLYRAVHPKHWVDGRISSAAFRSHTIGISVDRDGERPEEVTIEELFKRRGRDHGMAKIGARECRECGAFVFPRPEEDNPYHADIVDGPDSRVQKDKRIARRLAKSATVISAPQV